jgi:hypothetical protein
MEEKYLEIQKLLLEQGIRFVGCYYSGAGDSGSVERVVYLDDTHKAMYKADELIIDWSDPESDLFKNEPLLLSQTTIKELEENLVDLFYLKLDTIEDWWNNDGGYGSMVVDLTNWDYKIHNNQYYTEEQSYNHEGALVD